MNFTEPDAYIPERWLLDGDPRFVADRKEGLEPFQVGPRNCIGKSWAGLLSQGALFIIQLPGNIVLLGRRWKLTLAKLIWHFDLELAITKSDWADQKVFMLNERTPVNVKLTLTANA